MSTGGQHHWSPTNVLRRVGHLLEEIVAEVPTWGPIAPCPAAWWPRNGRRTRGPTGRTTRRRRRRSMWSVILLAPAGVRPVLRRGRRHPVLRPLRRTAPRYFIMVSAKLNQLICDGIAIVWGAKRTMLTGRDKLDYPHLLYLPRLDSCKHPHKWR